MIQNKIKTHLWENDWEVDDAFDDEGKLKYILAMKNGTCIFIAHNDHLKAKDGIYWKLESFNSANVFICFYRVLSDFKRFMLTNNLNNDLKVK